MQNYKIYSWYVVIVLLIVNIIGFIDRQVLSLMVEMIKADLLITDTQFSLLHGFAFTLFYVLFGIPIGRFVDTRNRRNVLTIGVISWALMTAACGLAKSFWSLFLFRVGVGAGEATLHPSAYSIISDYFDETRRGRALAVYSLGLSLGIGGAMLGGGALVELARSLDSLVFPLVGELVPWQFTFMAVGLPGILVAMLLFFTVKEPTRKEIFGSEDKTEEPSLREASIFFVTRWRTYLPIYLGFSFAVLTALGTLAWLPGMFIRVHGWSVNEVGVALGLIIISVGSVGVYFAGWLADWLRRRGHTDAPMRSSVIGQICFIPFGIAAPLISHESVALIMFAIVIFFIFYTPGVAALAIQNVTPNRLRGIASAVHFLVVSILGAGLGPIAVAVFTDYVFKDEMLLNYSLSAVSAIFVPLSVLVLWYGMKHYYKTPLTASAQTK